MNIQKMGDFSFAGNMKVCDKPVQVKETISELQDKDIRIKIDISKEGLEALHKKVQEMPGHLCVRRLGRVSQSGIGRGLRISG